MVLIAAGVILLIYYKAVSHFDGLAHDRFIIDRAKVDVDNKTAKVQSVQTDLDKIALQTKLDAEIADRQNRDKQIAKLISDLATQRQRNDSLTPSDLSLRWASLIGVQPTEINATAGGIAVSISAGHTTVNLLEEVSVLRETHKQDQNLLTKQIDLMTGFQKVITDLENEKATCKRTLVDSDATHKAEISKIKDDARKKGFWYALGGFIGGVLARSKF